MPVFDAVGDSAWDAVFGTASDASSVGSAALDTAGAVGADTAASVGSAASSGITEAAVRGAIGSGTQYLGDLWGNAVNYAAKNPIQTGLLAGMTAGALQPAPKMPRTPQMNFPGGFSPPTPTSTANARPGAPGSGFSPLLRDKPAPLAAPSQGLNITPPDEKKKQGGMGIV